MKNKKLLSFALAIVLSLAVQADNLGSERDAKQAELDTACEVARQEKLIVVRAELIEECVKTKERGDPAFCERFYADYGESSANNQVPLFYDLPECEKALEYRRSYRSSGR